MHPTRALRLDRLLFAAAPDAADEASAWALNAALAGWIGARSGTGDVEVRVETAAGVPHVEVIRAVLRDRHDLVIVPSGTTGKAARSAAPSSI